MVAELSQVALLEKKLGLIQNMRDITAGVDLSNSQAEENYIALMSRRDAIITQLRGVDAELECCVEEDGSEELRRRIAEASGEVLTLDNEMSAHIPELMKGIKSHLKQIHNGRDVSRAYHKDVLGIISEGSYNFRK